MTTKTDARELAGEYRPSMDKDVLHSWAVEAAQALRALQAERDEAVRLRRVAEALSVRDEDEFDELTVKLSVIEACLAQRDKILDTKEAALAKLAAENEGLRADCIRLNNEKIDRFERAVIAEASLTEARAEMAGLREALAARRPFLMESRCQCDDPLIRCDMHGCRCTLCGLPENRARAALESLPAPDEAAPASWVEAVSAENARLQALVGILQADLARLAGDYDRCEGCGAPIADDEDACTASDIRGCWGYAADVKGAQCWRYRTKEGMDRAWPECAALASSTSAESAGGGVVAWFSTDADGDRAATVNSDTAERWRALGRTITALYASPPIDPETRERAIRADEREACALVAWDALRAVVISETGGTVLPDHVAAAIRARGQ